MKWADTMFFLKKDEQDLKKFVKEAPKEHF